MAQDYGSPLTPTPIGEPPKKSNTTMIIIIVVVVLLLCCCCLLAVGGYLYQNGDRLFSGISSLMQQLLL